MNSITRAYLAVMERVVTYSNAVATANHGNSIEYINNTCHYEINAPFIECMTRNLNYRYPCAETRWVIAGSNRLDYSTSIQKTQFPWSDNDIFMAGAYGPKFVDQLSYIVDLLRAKPTSRQAYISFWRESPRKTKDTPCTLGMQFLIREGYLHCITNMRSSDTWLGLPNDMMCFALLAADVLIELKIPDLKLGTMYLNLGSSHIYMKDLEACTKLLENPDIQPMRDFDFAHWSHPAFLSFLSNIASMPKEDARKELLV